MIDQPIRSRNLRLANYDYASIGTYFVTICIQNRACVLGEISSGEMHRSPVEEMVETHLRLVADRYRGIELDQFVLMPNHLHALFNIGWCIDPVLVKNPPPGKQGMIDCGPKTEDSTSLFRVMQWFKSATTNEYIRRVEQDGWPRFPGKLWQAKYYDHIVRDQRDLDRIRAYIAGNPGKWEVDSEYSPTCRGFVR